MDDELLMTVEKIAPVYAGIPPHTESTPSAVQSVKDVLEKLVQRSVQPEGRESLGQKMAVERLVSLLPDFSQQSPALRNLLRGTEHANHTRSTESDAMDASSLVPLIDLLRVLRNLCAGVLFNQERLILCGGHDCVAALADRLILFNLQSQLLGERKEKMAMDLGMYNLGRMGSPTRWEVSAGVPARSPDVLGESTSQEAESASANTAETPCPESSCDVPTLPFSEKVQPSVPARSVPPLSKKHEGAAKPLKDRRSNSGRMISVPGLSLSPRSAALSSNATASPLSRFSFTPHPSPAGGASWANQGAIISFPATVAVSGETADALCVVLQLLGNVVGGGGMCQTAVWERCFPGMLGRAAAVQEAKVQGPLCMLLFNCCRLNVKQCEDLSGRSEGVAIVGAALRAHGGEEWLELLVDLLCFQQARLPTLFAKLGPSNPDPAPPFTPEQAALLSNLLAGLEAKSALGSLPQPPGKPEKDSDPKGASGVVVEELVRIVDRAATSVAGMGGGEGSARDPALSALACSLKILRLLFAGHSKETGLEGVAKLNVIPLVLKLLSALPVPAAAGGKKADGPGTSGSGFKYPQTNVYEGYRRDLVAIVGNAVYESKGSQKVVRELGGVILMLQQCVVEDENPFLREWGLFAMRNLLEGNRLNQKEVEDLKIKGGVATPELTEMGLKVEVDPDTGKPKLMNIGASDRST